MSTNPPWFALPKRKRLAAECSDVEAQVVIVGSGLAGCHIAFELAQRDIKVILVDAGDTVASGASGSNAGIVKPFVTRAPCLADKFYETAFAYLINRFDEDEALRCAAQFNQCGVLQLVEHAYGDNDAYTNCSAQQASELAGVNLNTPALFFDRGGWLNPAMLCQALVQHHNIDLRWQCAIESITKNDSQWTIATGNDTLNCQTLILANGNHLNHFDQTRELPITPARGQTSRFTDTNGSSLNTVVTGKRYAIPDGASVIVGASFSRNNLDQQISEAEHQQNLTGLATLLPSLQPHPTPVSGYCGIRATTPDRLPMVGPVPDFARYRCDYALIKHGLPQHQFPSAHYQEGLFVIGGFGSRGIVSAPYCAKLLADYLCDTDQCSKVNALNHHQPLASWSQLLHPGRFIVRELKRADQLENSTYHE